MGHDIRLLLPPHGTIPVTPREPSESHRVRVVEAGVVGGGSRHRLLLVHRIFFHHRQIRVQRGASLHLIHPYPPFYLLPQHFCQVRILFSFAFSLAFFFLYLFLFSFFFLSFFFFLFLFLSFSLSFLVLVSLLLFGCFRFLFFSFSFGAINLCNSTSFLSFLRWRLKYLSVLAWMGRSTLETYLLQFHLFLSSSSKTQVVYVPGYPYVNFLVGTTIFLYLSHKTLHLTNTLSDALISYSVHNPPSLIL